MSFNSGYRGAVGGAVQTSYTDQPGIAVAGMLAFASDLNNCDALFVGETDGVAAGKAVKVTALDPTVAYNLQRPNDAAFLPEAGDTVADFAGVVVFDEAMQSDENGAPGWAYGRVSRIAKPGRAGARIYVPARVAIVKTDAVHMVLVAGTDGVYEAGDFAPEALAGTAEAGTSTDVSTKARWVEGADAGGYALLELV